MFNSSHIGNKFSDKKKSVLKMREAERESMKSRSS